MTHYIPVSQTIGRYRLILALETLQLQDISIRTLTTLLKVMENTWASTPFAV